MFLLKDESCTMNSEIQEKNMSGREEITLGLNVNKPTENSEKSEKKFRGFHLTRSKWDPYPWVGSVETESDAQISGLRYNYHLIKH